MMIPADIEDILGALATARNIYEIGFSKATNTSKSHDQNDVTAPGGPKVDLTYSSKVSRLWTGHKKPRHQLRHTI